MGVVRAGIEAYDRGTRLIKTLARVGNAPPNAKGFDKP
jgi:hypothetical protein